MPKNRHGHLRQRTKPEERAFRGMANDYQSARSVRQKRVITSVPRSALYAVRRELLNPAGVLEELGIDEHHPFFQTAFCRQEPRKRPGISILNPSTAVCIGKKFSGTPDDYLKNVKLATDNFPPTLVGTLGRVGIFGCEEGDGLKYVGWYIHHELDTVIREEGRAVIDRLNVQARVNNPHLSIVTTPDPVVAEAYMDQLAELTHPGIQIALGQPLPYPVRPRQ